MRTIVKKSRRGSSKKGKLQGAIAHEVQEYLESGSFSGLCKCGCGGKTEVADRTRRNRDNSLYCVAGYPVEYIKGHGPNVAKGERNSRFKGEETIRRGGYVMVYAPEHPRAQKGRVAKHILVMEEHIGRYLIHLEGNHKGSEVVHHKDLDRSNNELSNLQLMTCEEHSRLHRELEGKEPIGCHRKGYNKFRRSQVIEMLARVEEGESIRSVAIDYGMSATMLSTYNRGKVELPKV